MKSKKSKQEIRQEIRRDFAKAITGIAPLFPAIFLMTLGMIWGAIVKQNYDGTIGADEYWLGLIIASFSAFLAMGLYWKSRVDYFWNDRELKKERKDVQKKLDRIIELLELKFDEKL